MQLIVLSAPAALPGEGDIINELFACGLQHFHLRKPDVDMQQVRKLLATVHTGWLHRIALHQFHHLADEYGIRRLHYKEQYRHTIGYAGWQQEKEAGYQLTTSVHSIAALQTLPPLFDYTFYGPVFNSLSKQQYAGTVDPSLRLSTIPKQVPVIALGGIDATNIGQAMAMQFDGIAVLGALWNEPQQAVENFKTIHTLCQQGVLM